ncbi:MAG: hypothetical protein K0R28_6461, partial [Paenibacillus sp.]|nr:hypothetical protein [Paenibacillus sp.]
EQKLEELMKLVDQLEAEKWDPDRHQKIRHLIGRVVLLLTITKGVFLCPFK